MPAQEQLLSGPITWLMFPALTVPTRTPVLLAYRLLSSTGLGYAAQPCSLIKIGTQQLSACNSKHMLLSFSVARCFFTFLVPQVFCCCELTYSDTQKLWIQRTFMDLRRGCLLWGLGGGTSSLSSLLRSRVSYVSAPEGSLSGRTE